MKRFFRVLVFTGLFIIAPVSFWHPYRVPVAEAAPQYSLQVATLATQTGAQKEVERLKSFNLKAQAIPWTDANQKTWFVIYVMGFQSKEEANKQGNTLIQNGVIKTFRISLHKAKEEAPVKTEKPPSPPSPPQTLKKEVIPLPGNSPIYVGPIFSEESKPEKPAAEKESPPPPSHELSKSREEAIPKKKPSVQKKELKAAHEKSREEAPPSKVKEPIAGPVKPKKEPSSIPSPLPVMGKSPVYFGPISIKEEENAIRINFLLERKIFPEITADKITEGSRLIITFKNIDRYVVPFDFEKIQSKTLLALNLAQKSSDCTLIILLNSSNNYEVAQNYYEKEKIYSLVIGKEPGTNQRPASK